MTIEYLVLNKPSILPLPKLREHGRKDQIIVRAQGRDEPTEWHATSELPGMMRLLFASTHRSCGHSSSPA